MKVYANRLGMIPSTEIALALRLAADQRRRSEELRRGRETRARERALRRREFWARVRAGLSGTRRARVA
jgi:hypothetical protein